jgi:hypothetical protein
VTAQDALESLLDGDLLYTSTELISALGNDHASLKIRLPDGQKAQLTLAITGY